jgi:hypothetical protein
MFIFAWDQGIRGIYDVKSAGFFSGISRKDVQEEHQDCNAFQKSSYTHNADATMNALAKLKEIR